MIIIASDGGCKNNGKENCISSYGVACSDSAVFSGHERNSTSQRGELHGCIAALKYALQIFDDEPIALLFDSAYIANAIKQRWFDKWARTGWKTSTNEPVKNRDLWVQIQQLVQPFEEEDLCVYQIKGHTTLKGPKSMDKCRESFIKNNGGLPPEEVLYKMITLNNLADQIAGQALDLAVSEESF